MNSIRQKIGYKINILRQHSNNLGGARYNNNGHAGPQEKDLLDAIAETSKDIDELLKQDPQIWAIKWFHGLADHLKTVASGATNNYGADPFLRRDEIVFLANVPDVHLIKDLLGMDSTSFFAMINKTMVASGTPSE